MEEIFFEKYNPEEIAKNIKDLINSYKSTNNLETKNSLKTYLKSLLDHICLKKDSTGQKNQFLKILHEEILELCLLFPEIANSFFKNLVNELEEYIFKKKKIEYEDVENDITCQKIINSSLLIVYLTNKINQPNQILANFILILNNFISKLAVDTNTKEIMNEENLKLFSLKILITGLLVLLSENTQSFNPTILNQLEYISVIFKNNLERNFDEAAVVECYKSFIETTQNMIELYRDDINFENIFKTIIQNIVTINNDKSNNADISQINSNTLKLYETYKMVSLQKKTIGINFLKIKKKPLPSLEPEIDLSFLGDNFKNVSKSQEILSKAIKKKTRNTKKQAIRNLKKEAKVIDAQRQKVLEKMAHKRKEDLKASNQFIEQQNIEYKKLMTGQAKKRLKFKKQRGKTK